MPLPDERPRQSVANLIGKFETQSKHLSPSQINLSRSSSVVSQVTSDLAKEEKREWPPKLMVEKTAPGPYRVMPMRINPDPRKEPAVQTETETPPALQYKQQQAQSPPDTFLENWRKGLPQPTEMEPEPTTPKPADEPPAPAAPVQKVVSAPQPPRTPTMKTSAKIPASTSSKSAGTSTKTPGPAKSAWKSPKQPSTPANSAQPLKPQHTGQSMVSSTSRRSISRAANVTKTPTRTETGTKTPTPRSKTPSSGLFAPTAASLAKARNAPLPPPPPIKRTAISSDAMDRLSRPTAASLSRVKTGPTSPVSTPKSPPRISSVKSKSNTSPSKSPQTKVKKDAATPQDAVGAALDTTVAGASAALIVVESAPEQSPPEPTTNGHHANDVPLTDVPTTPEVEVEQTHLEAADVSGDVVEPEVSNEDAAPSHTPEIPEAEPEIHNFTNGVEAASKTDLEDIVILLETAPAARPFTEEISEIPDEDD